MKKSGPFLLDTHALLFWNLKQEVSEKFINFFDQQAKLGTLLVSSISFWEIALLNKKGRIRLKNVTAWKDELLAYSGLQLINPSATEMIQSTQLPKHHKDPFDRLLLVQAKQLKASLVTKDRELKGYDVDLIWM